MKSYFWLGMVSIIFLAGPTAAWAGGDEVSVLREQLLDMERRHQAEMQALKSQIRTLETRIETTRKEAPADSASLETRLAALEEKTPFGKELPSMRGLKFELGGELEYEYVDTENDESVAGAAPANPGGRFAIDKLVLTPKVHYGDHLTLKADLEFQSDAFKLDELYVVAHDLPTAPYLSYIKIGLDDIMNSTGATGWGRHTEDYPLIGTAFWQDEDRMIEVGGDIAPTPFYWRASISNGRRLRTRSPNDASAGHVILHDDDDNPDGNFDKELRAGVGFKYDTGSVGAIDVLAWGADAELSAADLAVLQGITGYTGGVSPDENNELGVMAMYEWGGFEVQGQFIHANDGQLERNGWYVQPLYKIPVGAKYLKSITPFVRYGELDIKGLPAVSTDPLTWDREKLTFALIADIINQVKFKFEYKINDEETGAGEVNNDEFLTQLEMKF